MIRVSHNCDMGSFLGPLVRGLRLVDLNLTSTVLLRILWFSSLRKNKLSRQNLCVHYELLDRETW